MPQKITDEQARNMVCPIMTTSVAVDKPSITQSKGTMKRKVDRRIPCHGLLCPKWEWVDPPQGQLAPLDDSDRVETVTLGCGERPDGEDWVRTSDTAVSTSNWMRREVIGPRRGFCSYGCNCGSS